LENQGLICRRRYCDRPPRFEYILAQAGRALGPAIEELQIWGTRYSPSGERALLRHPRSLGTCPEPDRSLLSNSTCIRWSMCRVVGPLRIRLPTTMLTALLSCAVAGGGREGTGHHQPPYVAIWGRATSVVLHW